MTRLGDSKDLLGSGMLFELSGAMQHVSHVSLTVTACLTIDMATSQPSCSPMSLS
jgi:hypothetical protein